MNLRRLLPLQRGQGLVEFAVIFPIFGILICGLVDGGVVMGRYNQTTHAATVGARLGSVQSASANSVVAGVFAQVKQNSPGKASDYVNNCTNFDSLDAAVCVQWLPGPNNESPGDIGSSIRVKVKYHYDGITPIISALGGWDVSACVVERQEQPITGASAYADLTSMSCSGGSASTGTPPPIPTNTPLPTNTPIPTNTPPPPPPTNTPPPPTPTRTPTPNATATERAERTATAQAQQTARAAATATERAERTSTAAAQQTATASAPTPTPTPPSWLWCLFHGFPSPQCDIYR